MTREEKLTVINELSEKFAKNASFYLTDASGMSVEQTNKFRRAIYDAGLEYAVAKNTLIGKALEKQEADFSELNDVLKGFSGIVFSEESPNAPAKLLKKFLKDTGGKKPVLKAASVQEAVFIGADKLDVLIALKSKDELLGDLIGLLQSPAKNVISALKSGQDTIGGLVKTLQERAEAS